jgi:hypothetical protein
MTTGEVVSTSEQVTVETTAPLPPEWERPTLWLCNGKTE